LILPDSLASELALKKKGTPRPQRQDKTGGARQWNTEYQNQAAGLKAGNKESIKLLAELYLDFVHAAESYAKYVLYPSHYSP